MLFIFAGLPGTGKTTLARLLAQELRATYLRIDTIEQGLSQMQHNLSGPEGYEIAYCIAADNLRLGLSVIADSVNPIEITRSAWRDVAINANTPLIEIEVICSDRQAHRTRIESRKSDIIGHCLPTWQEVESHEYETWKSKPIVIDTAGHNESESFQALWQLIKSSIAGYS